MGERGGGGAELRHDRVGPPGRRVEPHQNERSAGVAPQEQRVARVPVAPHPRDARHGDDCSDDAVHELAPRRRDGRRATADHEQRVLRERRPKPRCQLRLNAR